VLDHGDTCKDVVHALEAAALVVTVAHGPADLEACMADSGDVDLLLIGDRVEGLDGTAACRVVRGDPRHAEIPVLITTPALEPQLLRAAAMSGAEGVVAEPVDAAALRARTIGLIERSRALRNLAETDRLTGLANRHKLDEELARFTSLADRFHQPLTLTLIDLDHFKHVNDRYGHLMGDAVLRAVARLLCDRYRGEDVVARWGGEELAVVTFGMLKADSTRRAGESLRALRRLEFPAPDGGSFRVAFSAGVAEYPTDATDTTGLYRAADAALYTAKATGRDRVVAAT
jgi:diguanylate cyclase (GGDEF)-like protein